MRELRRRTAASDGAEPGDIAASTPSKAAAVADAVRAPSDRQARLARWVFLAIIAVALPLILFELGSHRWFHGDEYWFLLDRKAGSLNDLFRDYNGHWSTVPVLAFRALWTGFGLRSYLPYQFCVVVLHLAVVVLLRLIMRRAGVGPWIATAAAAVLVFFGPGEGDIIWAFQIGFTGALFFGLVQLLLADHDGPIDRRDGIALLAGLLALMSSGVGVTMVFVVGVAMLLRRGWRVALLHVLPLATAYLVWVAVVHPGLSSPRGRPTLGTLVRWLRSAEEGTFVGLGHFRPAALLLAVLLVVGFGLLAIQSARSGDGWRDLRQQLRRVACPVALLCGGVAFATLSAQSRWSLGPEAARADRYLYIGAALTLPALAVAIDVLARRWPMLAPALVVLLLVATPYNIGAFGARPFPARFFDEQERVLTTVVRMPFARQVPRTVNPTPNVLLPPQFTIGFLLDAHKAGKLRASTGPVPVEHVNELKVRLGVAQTSLDRYPSSCSSPRKQLDVDPPKGTVYVVLDPVIISTTARGKVTSVPVVFEPRNGLRLTIELPDLHLRLQPKERSATFRVCQL